MGLTDRQLQVNLVEIWTLRQKIPSDSVDASYESQILMVTNRRLYTHLGYVGAV